MIQNQKPKLSMSLNQKPHAISTYLEKKQYTPDGINIIPATGRSCTHPVKVMKIKSTIPHCSICDETAHHFLMIFTFSLGSL
jgi:hypothetical protein